MLLCLQRVGLVRMAKAAVLNVAVLLVSHAIISLENALALADIPDSPVNYVCNYNDNNNIKLVLLVLLLVENVLVLMGIYDSLVSK